VSTRQHCRARFSCLQVSKLVQPSTFCILIPMLAFRTKILTVLCNPMAWKASTGRKGVQSIILFPHDGTHPHNTSTTRRQLALALIPARPISVFFLDTSKIYERFSEIILSTLKAYKNTLIVVLNVQDGHDIPHVSLPRPSNLLTKTHLNTLSVLPNE